RLAHLLLPGPAAQVLHPPADGRGLRPLRGRGAGRRPDGDEERDDPEAGWAEHDGTILSRMTHAAMSHSIPSMAGKARATAPSEPVISATAGPRSCGRRSPPPRTGTGPSPPSGSTGCRR